MICIKLDVIYTIINSETSAVLDDEDDCGVVGTVGGRGSVLSALTALRSSVVDFYS